MPARRSEPKDPDIIWRTVLAIVKQRVSKRRGQEKMATREDISFAFQVAKRKAEEWGWVDKHGKRTALGKKKEAEKRADPERAVRVVEYETILEAARHETFMAEIEALSPRHAPSRSGSRG